jgi:hypothetical protein
MYGPCLLTAKCGHRVDNGCIKIACVRERNHDMYRVAGAEFVEGWQHGKDQLGRVRPQHTIHEGRCSARCLIPCSFLHSIRKWIGSRSSSETNRSAGGWKLARTRAISRVVPDEISSSTNTHVQSIEARGRCVGIKNLRCDPNRLFDTCFTLSVGQEGPANSVYVSSYS